MSHILITGGAGFIGSHLTGRLLELGHEVTVIDNLITGSHNNTARFESNDSFHFMNADISSYDLASLQDENIELVYHLASPASPPQYKKYPVETLLVNSLGTHRLLEFIRVHSPTTKFVLASTSEVYGDPLVHPQSENYWGNVNPNGVRSMYDEAKRFAEAMVMTYVRSYDLDCRIARIFNTYGPGMQPSDGRIISNFIMQALRQEPITVYGDGTQTRSCCYVSDLVQGLVLLGTTENLKGEVINLGSTDEKPVRFYAEHIKKLAQSSSPIVQEAIGGDDPRQRKPDIAKAKKLLNWSPTVSLDEGLEKTIEYFRTLL